VDVRPWSLDELPLPAGLPDTARKVLERDRTVISEAAQDTF
jgi:hypothetical protein